MLRYLQLPATDRLVARDMTTGKLRPFNPCSIHSVIFTNLHSISHPEVRASINLIAEAVWLKMKHFCLGEKTFTPFQRNKIYRHVQSSRSEIPTDEAS